MLGDGGLPLASDERVGFRTCVVNERSHLPSKCSHRIGRRIRAFGKTTGRDERDLLPICDQDDCGPLVSLSTHFGGFQSDAIDSSALQVARRRGLSSQWAHSCLPRLRGDLVSCESMCWAWRAARGGPRRARVRPKTQAEMRQQQSVVGHNPLMLVTVALLSRMGYGC